MDTKRHEWGEENGDTNFTNYHRFNPGEFVKFVSLLLLLSFVLIGVNSWFD
jgi:hypothetical protein